MSLHEQRERAFTTPAEYARAILEWEGKPQTPLTSAVMLTLREGLRAMQVQQRERP